MGMRAMLAVARRRIDADELASDVEAALARTGGALLVETLDGIEAGTVVEVEQPEDGITYASTMTRADSPIDWTLPARGVHDAVRGLHPWPLASTWLSGERVIAGKHILLQARHGKGSVILFGFRPQFRAQSTGTFKFRLNAIYLASAKQL